MKKLLLTSIILLTFSSCKITHTLIELNRTTAKTYSYKLDDKDLLFVPMHHLGKKEFYANVKKLVTENKSKGFVVYYELVSTDFTNDSLLKDTIRRKARKLKGFSGTYKENAEGSYFEKYIQQPTYTDLGTDDRDLRADVNYLQLINQWENVNGQIILDSLDLNTPFNQDLKSDAFYTKREFNRVFITYRNDYLLNMIKTSPDKKILILYGAGHRMDFAKGLKR